ncbi:hypothetical protein [Paraburkholderia sp. SOS3]|uniref:hypothetical protein n=1 Tax=Paraburkholderia sp. SOS3 TaxID=1926494 RepID=UPI0009476CF0|nr:hypothetical protein [Paraburkholderia sp. SOS3]APR36200.1 hypothetical protein BTO02_13140 [Paraburkholderia sp. SOS3]
MELSIFGIAVILTGLAVLYMSYRAAIYGMAVFSLFGCALALGLGGMGILPPQLFLAFFALRAFNLVGGKKLADAFSLDTPGFWLLCTSVWACMGAIVLPRLLHGSTLVFPVDRSVDEIMLQPLAPVSGNVSQVVYCVGDVVVYCCMAAFLKYRGAYRTLANALLVLTALNVLSGVVDFASHAVGVDALAFTKTAQFADLTGEELGGLVRISGTFSETSAFSTFSLPLFVFCLNLWILGWRPKLAGALAFATGGLLLISTSGSAYVGLAGYLVILLFSRPSLVTRAAAARKHRMWIIATCMGVLGVLYVVLFLPGVVKALSDFVDITVMSKAGSSSGVERMGWNAQGMTNFFDTYGIGVGLGSIRASSFLVVLLGSLGVVGTFCYAMFVGKSLLSPVSADYPFTERAVCYAARHAVMAALIVVSISGSVFELGSCFYLFAAAAGALSARVPRRVSRRRQGAVAGAVVRG